MSNNLIDILQSRKIQEFINEHENESVQELVLKFSGKNDLPVKEIAEQIECRQKAGKKLPTLSGHNLLYKKVSLEQASSEATASYKASRLRGNRIIDLTGGLGIDSIYFSKKFDEVVYCEINEELARIAQNNFNALGIKNIKVLTGDGIDLLSKFEDNYFDCLFVDPSRRDESKRSVDIAYMKPDVLLHRKMFLSKAKKVCMKLAPAFDINEAFRVFEDLKVFEVISVNNECKEVLLFFDAGNNDTKQRVSAVILSEKGGTQVYSALNTNDCIIRLVVPEKDFYLYEPDVAIRRAGLTGLIADQLKMSLTNNNSEYLIKDTFEVDFPGRKFLIKEVLNYNVKEVTKYLVNAGIKSANIARNNFPKSPPEIKNILKLKDGGTDYLFFTRDMNNKLIFIHTVKA